jgi:nucleoside-diphosphate-sugar epimerase
MRVFFFGIGFCAETLIRRWPGIEAAGSVRTEDRAASLRASGVEASVFDGERKAEGIEAALARAEAIVVSIPPRGEGPLGFFREAIGAAPRLRRIVYYSTVGVYGQHDGAWVDEAAETRATAPRSLARLREEARWRALQRPGVEVDRLRLPGIYGPGRNALARLRAGGVRRIVKPGHVTNRAHVEDIAEVTRLVLSRGLPGQIWNVADDDPAPPQDVIVHAAWLLGLTPPPEEPFDPSTLSDMSTSFFADEKRVSNAKAKRLLGFAPLYPSYREGLRALFDAGEGRDAA